MVGSCYLLYSIIFGQLLSALSLFIYSYENCVFLLSVDVIIIYYIYSGGQLLSVDVIIIYYIVAAI